MENPQVGTQPAAPVQVQVVPNADPERVAVDRFAEKLARMPNLPSMNEGDRTLRQTQDRIPGVTPDAQTPPATPASETKTEAAEAAAAEGDYEFEWKGQRYAVPTELKEMHEGYLRNDDYTRKTQETAEIRRSAELMLQQASQSQALQQAVAPISMELQGVNERLAAYSKVDWGALIDQAPIEAQKHQAVYHQLKDRQAQLKEALQTTASDHMTKINQTRTALQAAADKVLGQKIKGYSPERGKALNEFARKTYGFSETEANSTIDPRVVEMMHDAMQWRDLQQSKPLKVVAPQKTLIPGASQGGTDAQAKNAELRRGLKVAKTDGARDRAAEALLMSRMR